MWAIRDVYKGFAPQYVRATGMLTYYFTMLDFLRRHTNLWDYKLGQFLASGGSAMTGYWIIWPFEILKNLAQADNKIAGNSALERC